MSNKKKVGSQTAEQTRRKGRPVAASRRPVAPSRRPVAPSPHPVAPSRRPVAPSPSRSVAPSPRRPVAPSPPRSVVSSPSRPAAFDKVFEKIYRLVLRIPRGRVMTYGQIARLLEERYSPRLVGWAMHATPKDERNIPWHRVINSQGAVSTGRVILAEPDRQRLMLEAEGVVFDVRGRCDLAVYQWSPRQRAAQSMIKTLRTNKPRAASGKTTAAKKPKNIRK